MEWYVWTGPAVGVVVGSLIAARRRREAGNQLAVTAALALLGGAVGVLIVWLLVTVIPRFA